jgi:hypothetical protein
MEDITILKDIMDANNTQFHSYADYSVTGIIDTPKVTILRKRHKNKPSVKSQLAAFYGTANHDRMEKMLRKMPHKYAVERSMVMPVMLDDKTIITLSGKYDALQLQTRFLWDLKTCNTWKIIFDPDMEKWHEQANIYNLMCAYVGEEIKGLNILAWYKDWKKNSALRDKSYPQNQCVEYNLKMWSKEKTSAFTLERLELMHEMNKLEDDDIPECSREDRWERHPNGDTVQYALMKNDKAARALRCKPTMAEIIEFARTSKALTGESFIEVRYAEPTRCVDYCGVNYACHWYKNYCAKNNAGSALTEFIPIGEVL